MKKLVIGNWKMNGNVDETLQRITALRFKLRTATHCDIAVVPPFTSLYSANVALQETNLKLGAQNIFWENEGAYTGEISGVFLKEVGCTYVLIGHSERRKYFGETDESVNKRIRAALVNELIPVVCIGETLEDREAGRTNEVLERQLKGGFLELSMNDVKTCLVAYEPVWAIGTGKTATTAQVEEAHSFIRNKLAKLYDAPTANGIPLLYGGSVKPDNAKELMATKNVDGVLVGGASLDVDQFVSICQAAN